MFYTYFACFVVSTWKHNLLKKKKEIDDSRFQNLLAWQLPLANESEIFQ